MGTAANDVLIVGAGLGGGLIALALTQLRPELRVTLLERGRELGGNHTWCFHAADCPEAARELVAPLLAARWPGYSVRFPGRRRRLASPYACITSDRLDQALVAAARRTRLQLEREAEVVHVAADAVELADGRRLTAPLVIDARGPAQRRDSSVAFQKFVGLELQVAPGHAIAEPILIDACVPQRDGFRFMYVLPLAPDRVLVEDTYYAERPDLDDGALEHGILDYAEGLGLGVMGVLRKERGVLPLPLTTSLPELGTSPIRAGYAGGFFHPVTGYSFPIAVRLALAIAASDLTDLARSPAAELTAALRRRLPFLYTLTRTMFERFLPAKRYAVLEHFYRLPEPLIARFYAAELSRFDQLRMFVGMPPRGMSLRRLAPLAREVAP